MHSEKTKPSIFQRFTALVLVTMILSIAAFATPTALSTQVLVMNNVQVTAAQLAINFVACDNVNGNSFVTTGREVIFAQNTDSSPHTITVTPVADPYGGTNTTLTNYSLAATGSLGAFSAIQMKYQIGWTSGTTISLTCNSALVKFAILQYN